MKNILKHVVTYVKVTIEAWVYSSSLILYINNQPVRIPVGKIIEKIVQSETVRNFISKFWK